MNLEGTEPDKFDKDKMTITDRWILSRLAKTITYVTNYLNEFKYSEPLTQLYRFFWNDFCDWYLEWIKPRMQDKKGKQIAQNVLAFVLDQKIAPDRRLQGLTEPQKSKALVVAEWPNKLDALLQEDAEKQISCVQTPVRTYRDMKNKYNISNSVMVLASASVSADVMDTLSVNSELICQLAGLKDFNPGINIEKPARAAVSVVDGMSFYMHDVIDLNAERKKLQKQKQQLENAKKAVEAKLNNGNFMAKAKPKVVAQAKEKLAQLAEQLQTVEKHLTEL
jgi:valyl-tRNA synthetase